MESAEDEIDLGMQELFRAYDLDESGELSREEFLSIEMRLHYEEGQVFRHDSGYAKMTLADQDGSGCLDYEEFRSRTLTSFQEMGMSRQEVLEHMRDQTKKALLERAKMGPRYHAGIRQVLRNIFALFDASGDGLLSPEEWISAQKTVAAEVTDDLDEGWVDEGAFQAADSNGDGVLDMNEFLEASFSMFEGVKKRTDAILLTLQRVEKVLHQQKMGGRKETSPVMVYLQSAEKPEFQPPSMAWQDEPTEEDLTKNSQAWQECGEVALPLNMATAEDVAALLRLHLKMPPDMWISIFFVGPARDAGEGPRPITLLRGERPGEGNTTAMLQYLSKPNAELKLYVKNARKRPSRLTRQPRAFLEEREALFAQRTGGCWGLDWETQLVGDGEKLPPRPMMINVGDTLIVEVPQTDEGGEYRYVANAFMDKVDVLSKPVNEVIEVKKAKKKKAKAGPEPDPLLQLTFVALKEGKCVLFVDVSWEDQEEKLCLAHGLTSPVAENTIARIGPIEVEVSKSAPKADKGTLQWWNGEKWSNKKGPAKKKKKGKK
eukprot:gb/GFBE01028499.1/.p1 GENE.gb/GFBE01028499.1/~~gb/GFBE01028499.1/.p1  ORF type:complete len:546 (+),score=139.99 gb/GFBE01028499.1/:1-1638(+)